MPDRNRPQVIVAWSSGKDSAWALYQLLKTNEVDVIGLMTTFNSEFDRVAMHSVRRDLVEKQASELRLPLYKVDLPWPCSNGDYETNTKRTLESLYHEQGATHLACGDLFLTDVRSYREKLLQDTGIKPLFPIWGEATAPLAKRMVDDGLRAIITCVDPKQLNPSFAARTFDAQFLADLPKTVDPCGENGEFHSFVYSGPMFESAIEIQAGEIVERDGFVFADVLPQVSPQL